MGMLSTRAKAFLALIPFFPSALHADPKVEWEASFGDTLSTITNAVPDGAGGYLLMGHRDGAGLIAGIGPDGSARWERTLPTQVEYLGKGNGGWLFRLAGNGSEEPTHTLIKVSGSGVLESGAPTWDGLRSWGADGTLLEAASGNVPSARVTVRALASDGSTHWERVLGPADGVSLIAVENGPTGAWIFSESVADTVDAVAHLRRIDKQGNAGPDHLIGFGHRAIDPEGRHPVRPVTLIREISGARLAMLGLVRTAYALGKDAPDTLILKLVDAEGAMAGGARIDISAYVEVGAKGGDCDAESIMEDAGVLRVRLDCGSVHSELLFDPVRGAFLGAEAVSPRAGAPMPHYQCTRDSRGDWVAWGGEEDTLAGTSPVGWVRDVWWPLAIGYPAVFTAPARGGTWTAHRMEGYRDTLWTEITSRGDCNCFIYTPIVYAVGFLPTSDGGGLLLGNFRAPGSRELRTAGALKLAPGFATAIVHSRAATGPGVAKPAGRSGSRVDPLGRIRDAESISRIPGYSRPSR